MFQFIKTKFLHPLKEFIHDSRAIGIVLLCCTAVSLLLANLPFSASYIQFWNKGFDGTTAHHTHLIFLNLPNSFLILINDGLMAIFFLMAGMEIKRELTCGELSSLQQALLPVAAAIGGMLIPAAIFLLCNKGTMYAQGWAIPTATDIAFTLGVASLLGKKVPLSLKIFLTALAIIDDLGAIIVIALFYGGAIKFWYVLGMVACVSILLLLNKLKVKFGIWNLIIGVLLWYCTFNSGVHATVAGVLFAFCIPMKTLSRLELKLHSPTYFLILPLFALANTAIVFPENGLQALTNSLSIGIIAGLFIGKPLGIGLAIWFMIKKNYAVLPTGVSYKAIIGAAILAGIGFTMSIFISTLAFENTMLQDASKLSVLIASFAAMLAGYFWLRSCKEVKGE